MPRTCRTAQQVVVQFKELRSINGIGAISFIVLALTGTLAADFDDWQLSSASCRWR